MNPIWGESQAIETCPHAPVWEVETDRHGGYVVDREWAKDNLPAAVYAIGDGQYGARGQGEYLYFEEDLDWAAFVYGAPAAVAEWCYSLNKDVMTRADWDLNIRGWLQIEYPQLLEVAS